MKLLSDKKGISLPLEYLVVIIIAGIVFFIFAAFILWQRGYFESVFSGIHNLFR